MTDAADIVNRIKKNLSNEDYHESLLASSSQLFKALQLCDCNGDREKCYELRSASRKAKTKKSTKNGHNHKQGKQKVKNIPFGEATNQTKDSSQNGRGNNRKVTTKISHAHFVWSTLDLAIDKQTLTKKLKKMSNELDNTRDPVQDKSTNWYLAPQSPQASEPDTVFSEDYTEMTDGDSEGSLTSGSCCSSQCSTGSMEFNFERMSFELANDIGDVKIDETGHHILKEHELPNLKLVLGLKVPDVEIDDAGQESPPKSPEESPVRQQSALVFHEKEFEFLDERKVKRSSSLKTTKTPPGTPSRKKAVRFADALGLDLEDVRHIMNQEDPPHVPSSATKDLKLGLEEEHKGEGNRYLRACFSQPGGNGEFISRVLESKVCLENCMVNDSDLTITGVVRVSNIAFHKKVLVRVSTNKWVTFSDIFATYVQNSNDGPTDRFSFNIGVPTTFEEGSKLEFALMYRAGDMEFWDNNFGRNYIIECYARQVPISANDSTWMHFL